MSATLLPADGSLAKGLAALERLLESEDERVALKAAELLLRWHPDVQKRKPGAAEVDTPAEAMDPLPTPPALTPIAPPVPPPVSAAKKKVLLAPFLPPPPPHRSTDPLPASFLETTKPLTSFLRMPKSTADPPR